MTPNTKRGIAFKDKNTEDKAGTISTEVLNNRDRSRDKVVSANDAKILNTYAEDKLNTIDKILKIFPEMKDVFRIVVTAILMPNDNESAEIRIDLTDVILPSDTRKSIITGMNNHIQKYYKLEEKLDEYVTKAMFTEGAVVNIVIPESIMRDVMGVSDSTSKMASVEKYLAGDKKLGAGLSLLGSNITYGLEDEKGEKSDLNLEEVLGINIIEDYGHMVVATEKAKDVAGKVTDIIRGKRKKSDTNIAEEYVKNIHSNSIDSIVASSYGKVIPNVVMGNADDGLPLRMEVSTSCVIPMTVYGDKDTHVAYIILLNENGSPISRYDRDKYNSGAGLDNTDSKTVAEHFINRASKNFINANSEMPKLHGVEQLYGELVDRAIKDRIDGGDFKGISEMNVDGSIYRVMFGRFLEKKLTKLLFVPAQFVNYHSYSHRPNGTGISRMEEVITLFSMRAIQLFVRNLASIKNSTNTTIVNGVISDDEPDPEGKVMEIITEVVKTRQMQYPLGTVDAVSLASWVQSANMVFNFTGGGLPETSVTMSDSNPSKTLPDDGVDEMLEGKIAATLGVTLEMIKTSVAEDFASTIQNRRILFDYKIRKDRLRCEKNITDYAKTIFMNDGVLRDTVRNILSSNLADIKKVISTVDGTDDDIVDSIMDNIYEDIKLYLPRPVSIDSSPRKAMMDEFSDILDKSLDLIFGDASSPTDAFGVAGEKIEVFKAALRNSAVRRFLNNNDIIPELNDFFNKDEDGLIIYDAPKDFNLFVEFVGKAVYDFEKENKKIVDKSDKKLGTIIDTESESDIGDDSTDNDSDVDTDNDNGDNGDLNLDDDSVDGGADDTTDDASDVDVTDDADEGDKDTVDGGSDDNSVGDDLEV